MQDSVKEFTTKYNLNSSIEIRLMDLVSEVGELSKELIKGSDYGNKEFSITDNTKSEIGDCLFSLLCLCNDLDIDANDALNSVLIKYRKRFDSKGNIGS